MECAQSSVAMLHPQWRCREILETSMAGDQLVVGLAGDDVVCARAIVRLVLSIRWDAEILGVIIVTPFDLPKLILKMRSKRTPDQMVIQS